MRAANEAAESVALINQLYVVPKEPKMKAVSRPLNLVVTAKSPEDLEKLKALVARLQNGPDGRNLFKDAMDKVGNVHDARFVFLPGDNLGVFTTYDDEFDRYLDLFVDEAGEIFNLLLAHVKDAPTARVQDDREAFRAFVKAHDLSSEGSFYSAYPDLRVQDIKAATRNPAQP
jgi:hypothetical protein